MQISFLRFGNTNNLYMTNDNGIGPLKLRDLRQLEKALETRIQLLLSYKENNHDKNAVFLTLAPEGFKMKYKVDSIQSEISHCEMMLERVQIAILAR